MARLLFYFGLISTIGLSVIIIWPDFEALRFQPVFYADEPLRSLRCPHLLTSAHPETISITVENTLSRPALLFVDAVITDGPSAPDAKYRSQVELEPGESEALDWQIDSQDTIYRRMVLARVHVSRSGSMPAQQKTCGVFVMPISFIGGRGVMFILSNISLIALAVGAFRYLNSAEINRNASPIKRNLIIAMTTLTAATYILGYVGQTMPAIMTLFLLAITFLSLFASFE